MIQSSIGGGSVGGVVGVTGSVGISGTIGITGPVGLTGSVGITGPVAVTFGVASVTFPVQNEIGITGPVGVTFGNVTVNSPIGLTGSVGLTGFAAVTFGVASVTFPVQNAIGITGPVATTFGVASVTFPVQSAIGITGPVAVTFGVVGVTFVQSPGVTFGPVGISGTPAVTFGVVGNTGAIGITGPVTVVGPAADGAAVSGNPVRVAGKDLSGNTQDMITGTDGRLWPFTGFVSTSNSRANANLASGATYAGTFEDITQFANINVGILDAGALGGTLVINWSEDGTNIRDTDTVAIPTANGQQFAFGRKWQYFQVVYGHAAAAGNVVIQSILSTSQPLSSTYFGTDAITTSQDGQLVISELRALNGSNFFNLLGDTTNGLDVDVTRISGSVGLTGAIGITGPVGVTFGPVGLTGSIGITGTVSTKTSLTGSAPTTTTVGTASASAVASNSSRRGLVLTNLSTNNIFFGIGVTAVLNAGIAIYGFGHWEMDEYTFSTAQINAIASGAGSTMAIQEFT